MWISYAHTTDAVIMGRKTRTRRNWAVSHARKFHAQQVCDFYERNPRNHGRIMGSILVTRAPWRQNTRKLTSMDFQLEGFDYMTEVGALIGNLTPTIFFQKWREKAIDFWVLDFTLEDLTIVGQRRKMELQGADDDRRNDG